MGTSDVTLAPPGLASGDYSLEVRSALGNGTLHTGALAETLIVGG